MYKHSMTGQYSYYYYILRIANVVTSLLQYVHGLFGLYILSNVDDN